MSEALGAPSATRPVTSHLIAAWLCAAGATAMLAFLVVALASGSVFGRGDATVGGAALVVVVVVCILMAALAASLAYAGYAGSTKLAGVDARVVVRSGPSS